MTIGRIIAEAMVETTLEIVEGMQFDRGYLSQYFVTDLERMEAVLDNPFVLIHRIVTDDHGSRDLPDLRKRGAPGALAQLARGYRGRAARD